MTEKALTTFVPMAESAVTITLEEYRELIIKAWKYETLREVAKASVYTTDFEKAIFELAKEETDDVDE